MRQWKHCAAVAVMMSGLLAACSTPGPLKVYEGPARSAADVVLVSVPEQVEVMAIDGQEPPPSFLKSRVQLALLPGEHVFSLRYVELFQLNSDEHEVVRSKQAALRFTAAAGSQYRLETPAQKNRDVAVKFARNPQFRLVNSQDGTVIESTAIKSYAEASLIDTLSKAFTANSGEEAAKQPGNLDLLKDVWGRATPEEQAGFRAWLNQQGK